MRPVEGSLGAVDALNFCSSPVSSITRQSVNVPPTSMQTRFLFIPLSPLIGVISAREAQYGFENRLRISKAMAARAWSELRAEFERPVIRAAIKELRGRGAQIATGGARQGKTKTRGRPQTARQ